MFNKIIETNDIDLSSIKRIELRNAYAKNWNNLSGKKKEKYY